MSKVEAKNDASNAVTITLDGDTGDISAGGNGQDGGIAFKDKDNKLKGYMSVRPLGGQIYLSGPDGKQAFFCGQGNLSVGGNGIDGDISLHPTNSSVAVYGQTPTPSIRLIGESSEIHLRRGDQNRIRLDGTDADAWLGGNGANGHVMLFAAGGDNKTLAKATVVLDGANGNIRVGGPGVHGNLALFRADVAEANSGDFDKATIHLNGSTGDILLANADCAEDFDIAEAEEIEPGTVMVLDQEGKLQQSREAYDKKVAGVISGAGDYKPGIVLDKQHSQNKRLPVALMGKVYCKVDAEASPIAVGDLLTTSPTPGHAMKACDPLRAFGAVIGKALRPLTTGQGLIPILIALQ